MKTVAVVQARMGSKRFPGKVMQDICGRPLIEVLLHRLSLSKKIDQIVLATSSDPRNQSMVAFVEHLGYSVYQGSEDDVLDRYYHAAKNSDAEVVIRITGDCPLIDFELIDLMIDKFNADKVDFLTNCMPPSFPDGLDTAIFSFDALAQAHHESKEPFEREHVTPYIRNSGKFCVANYYNEKDYSSLRWTVDEPADLEVVRHVFGAFTPKLDFKWSDVIELEKRHPDWFKANKHLIRNEGANMSKGQKLWKRAKQLIPGGNMLLSKRAEMFLPDLWPAYFSKAKGCKVWDLEGNEYIDMSIMGIGTNILGYGHPEVDEAVHRTVDSGNMSTLNCPEEVYLAERLIELHPWADMARFARTGGEANAIAIRIARAASGKDNVAFCGYHGWHDWYLSANLGDAKNLAGHLLPGLAPNGVPKSLSGTVYPFSYNNFEQLQSLVRNHDIGTIKMEVMRNQEPEDSFLHKVRKLATDNGIVLIFDECTSGFRQTFGGLHKQYGVEPDMAMFGKALGNGYAITATIGRRSVMEAAQSTFISSTFWTERIGPTAALKTLEVMEKLQSWNMITETGKEIGRRWEQMALKHAIPLRVFGLPSLIKFAFESPQALAYKTYVTQEMLAKGYLAGNSIYVCTEHTSDVLNGYFEALDSVFARISECEQGRDINEMLKGPICHSEFKRLN